MSNPHESKITFASESGKDDVVVTATEDGKVLLNDKEIKSFKEVNLAMNLIIRAVTRSVK